MTPQDGHKAAVQLGVHIANAERIERIVLYYERGEGWCASVNGKVGVLGQELHPTLETLFAELRAFQLGGHGR